ncbi:hypothetical protein CLU96_1881 [Chryseobacterium sp. 52]|nr:hypothetical protein CLU96_1881 [Chryseobacterium sp. 52]
MVVNDIQFTHVINSENHPKPLNLGLFLAFLYPYSF